MKYELWYEIVVRDRHGKVRSRERRKSRSFLKAWNEAVYLHMWAAGSVNMVDIGGVTRSTPRSKYSFLMKGGVGVTSYGAVVGTGNTAVTISDYQLDSLIAEGGGGGQLNYGSCSVAAAVVSAPNCGFTVSRTMTNNSGGDITIREAGVYFRMRSSAFYYFCGARDVLGAPHTVLDTDTVSVQYTLQVTA